MATKKQTASFSDAFEELETITEWFEGDEVDLEKGLKQFERALVLAKQCKEMLSEVENKVEELKKNYA